MDFKTISFGMSTEALCKITGLHPSTIRRYRKNNNAPRHIKLLIQIYKDGSISNGAKAWEGWRLVGECIADPEGNEYHMNEIRQLPHLLALQREFRLYRSKPAQFLLDL